jgi:hypothetical protein
MEYCAINLALASENPMVLSRAMRPMPGIKRQVQAKANILSATRLPTKNGRPLVLRPNLAIGLPFRG